MPAKKKVNREGQSRAANERVSSYTPPPLLPMPENEPGFTFKWIRKSTRGEIDTRNMARRIQQGWIMCRKEDYPEIARTIDPFAKDGDYLESGGLILAKIPEEIAQGIRAYNNRRAKAQVKAVDNNYFSLKDRGVEVFRDPESKVYTSRQG